MADNIARLPAPPLPGGWYPTAAEREWIRADWGSGAQWYLQVLERETCFVPLVHDVAPHKVTELPPCSSLRAACEAAEAWWCGCRVRR